MKTPKEEKPPVNPEALVLDRLVGMTRIMRKGNDPELAQAAAKIEIRLNREIEALQKAA